jgi:ferredoxin
MLRAIIKINEELCDGCGVCVPACAEGALQIIDSKARLISDLFCDGLGACITECPQGAITIEKREAEPYNESVVMETIFKGGQNVIKAHLKHLKDHREFEYFAQAIDYLKNNRISIPAFEVDPAIETKQGCPGSASREIVRTDADGKVTSPNKSQLRQWPIQLHLVSPNASYFKNSNLLLTADCVGFAYSNLHSDFLKGNTIVIACPKLDSNKQVYIEKLATMFSGSNINSITVLIMEVPCCSGLVQIAQQALNQSEKKIPLKVVVIGIEGDVLKEVNL